MVSSMVPFHLVEVSLDSCLWASLRIEDCHSGVRQTLPLKVSLRIVFIFSSVLGSGKGRSQAKRGAGASYMEIEGAGGCPRREGGVGHTGVGRVSVGRQTVSCSGPKCPPRKEHLWMNSGALTDASKFCRLQGDGADLPECFSHVLVHQAFKRHELPSQMINVKNP